MNLSDLLYALPPRRALAVAIGLSIVLYALAANVAWTCSEARLGRLGSLAYRLQRSRTARAGGELLRWLYYLVFPYVTLMLGYNRVRALGVWNLDWVSALVPAGALAIGAAVVVVWVWRPFTLSEHQYARIEGGWNWARHVVELLYQQAHWAFYRSGPILWLENVYWGSFLGLALVYLEGWSNPNVRSSIRDVARVDAPLWTGSLAVISTIVFLFTQNLWYCLAVHLALDLGVRTFVGFSTAAPQEDFSAFDAAPPEQVSSLEADAETE